MPGALGVAALTYEAPEPAPTADRVRHPSLPQVPDSVALAQLDRSAAATRLARKLTAPQLLAPARTGTARPSTLPTLALAPRATPYTLAELRSARRRPRSPTCPGSPGALLLDAHIEVPVGATLVVDAQTPDVRLPSGPSAFATIISRGTTTVAGTAQTPVRISTWDPQQRAPDARRPPTAARSCCRSAAGWTSTTAGSTYLGFGTGTSSGVAWRGAPPDVAGSTPDAGWIKAQGTVTNSVFAHNHFGAYTHEAQGMRWSGNTFADNEEYGFDPHDFSDDFVVEGNTARHNGKHGFIFSRGCDGNVLRGNTAYANAGHGFMIDDGRSATTATAEARIDPSNDNLVTGNVAYDNAGSGVEIEGGTGNVVSDNHAVAQRHRRARQGRRHGLRHRQHDRRQRPLRGARPRPGGPGGDRRQPHLRVVGGGQPRRGEQRDAGREPVDRRLDAAGRSAGVAQRDPSWIDRVGQFLHWNPVLVLWALILGVPLLVGAVRGRARAPAPRAATGGDGMTTPHRRGCREPWCCWPGWSCCSPAAPPRPAGRAANEAPGGTPRDRPAALARRRARGRSGPLPGGRPSR